MYGTIDQGSEIASTPMDRFIVRKEGWRSNYKLFAR